MTRAAPSSTYRLQLGSGGPAGADLEEAAGLVGYLAGLGVTHLYLSPVLQSAPGSTHGYDVVDPTRVDARIGGEAGWRALQWALAAHNAAAGVRADGVPAAGVPADRHRMGVVLDIVPNHMGVAPPRANPWWWDLIRRGPGSPYASWFDVDLSRGPVTLPYLPDPGPAEPPDQDPLAEARLVTAPDGAVEVEWRGLRLPVAPGTAEPEPDGAPPAVADVLARQCYRLVPWRSGVATLTYRRFFDVSDLAALRMDDPAVFDATHALVLRWVSSGEVDGLRIDHVDGLRDPRGYLARLRSAAPRAWVVVEKILEADEALPASWACDGTTGYEYLRLVCGLFVDPDGAVPLTRLDAQLTGGAADADEGARELWQETLADSKRYAASTILASELRRLVGLADAGGLADGVPDAGEALAELMAAYPVYRTYLPGADEAEDAAYRRTVRAVAGRAQARRPDLAPALAALVPRLLDPDDELCARMQQTTGMVMAKGVEDTAFYRHTRLVALNEVGGDPERFGVTPEEFLGACRAVASGRPTTMTTLSTHDTKRSEDVRARLAVLSEMPEEWGETARRWLRLLPPPDPAAGYLVLQTLVGAWPLDAGRMLRYLDKASREAKRRTSWTTTDPGYDEAMRAWASAWVTVPDLVEEVGSWVGRIAAYGWGNSLGQKLLQLVMPGTPDVYQGTELWDLSLVDPDNRRPVDWDLRRSLLARLDGGWVPPLDDPHGAAKLLVVSRALRLRRDRPDLFTTCDRAPVAGPSASHLVALDRGGAIALATRLPVGLERAGGWGGTSVRLPPGSWRCALTGRAVAGRDVPRDVPVGHLLDVLPVALLVRDAE